jgi:hypothetical protein
MLHLLLHVLATTATTAKRQQWGVMQPCQGVQGIHGSVTQTFYCSFLTGGCCRLHNDAQSVLHARASITPIKQFACTIEGHALQTK